MCQQFGRPARDHKKKKKAGKCVGQVKPSSKTFSGRTNILGLFDTYMLWSCCASLCSRGQWHHHRGDHRVSAAARQPRRRPLLPPEEGEDPHSLRPLGEAGDVSAASSEKAVCTGCLRSDGNDAGAHSPLCPQHQRDRQHGRHRGGDEEQRADGGRRPAQGFQRRQTGPRRAGNCRCRGCTKACSCLFEIHSGSSGGKWTEQQARIQCDLRRHFYQTSCCCCCCCFQFMEMRPWKQNDPTGNK